MHISYILVNTSCNNQIQIENKFNSIQFNLFLYSAITTPRKVHKALSIKYIKRQQYIKIAR